MSDDSTVGSRVRRLAKLRGMTQDDLRRATGLSIRTIKDVMGDHGNHRNETLHKIAVALAVHTSDLMSPGVPEHQPVRGEQWEEVPGHSTGGPGCRSPRNPPPRRGFSLPWRISRRRGGRASTPACGQALAGLVRDALSLDGSEDDRGAKSRALSATAWLLNMSRQFEDAWTAARLAMDAAPGLPDTLTAVSMMCWCLLRQGRAAEAGNLAVEWADRSEPRFSRATTGELAGFGKMQLYIANAMATDNRPGDAQDALSLARAAAVRIGRDVPFSVGTTARFGPATVTVIAAETAVLSWHPDRTLELADRVRGALGTIEPAQVLRHRLDVASAHAMRKEYGKVVEVMEGLRREAPQWLPNQQYARDILEDVAGRRRGPWPEDLRVLAKAVRLPAVN